MSFVSLFEVQKLAECVKKYLEDEEEWKNIDQEVPLKAVMDEFPDEPAYKKCKATLNSSSKFDTLVYMYIIYILHYFEVILR